MGAVTLAGYRAPDGSARRVGVLVLGPAPATARPRVAVLAAGLSRHPALVLDADQDDRDARVVGELVAGEGLAVARALIDDYLPRARRATRPLARALEPDDLLGGPAAEDCEEGAIAWAA